MDKKLIDVIIPAYRPGSGFQNLLKRLERQSLPVRRVLVMNTEEKFWDSQWGERISLCGSAPSEKGGV